MSELVINFRFEGLHEHDIKNPLCPDADTNWGKTIVDAIIQNHILPIEKLHTKPGITILTIVKHKRHGGHGLSGGRFIIASTQSSIVGHLAYLEESYLYHRPHTNHPDVRNVALHRYQNTPTTIESPSYQDYRNALKLLTNPNPLSTQNKNTIIAGALLQNDWPDTLSVLAELFTHQQISQGNLALSDFPHTILHAFEN